MGRSSNPSASPVLWVVQTNLGSSDTHEVIRTACERNGLLFQGVKIIPFSDDLPDVRYDGPVLAYGSTRFIRNVAASKAWSPGAFFDEEAFTIARCLQAWGGWMANSDSVIVRLDAVASLPYSDQDEIFVRPDRDLKEFAGQVMTFKALSDWAAVIAGGEYELDGSLLVAVGSPKRIRTEWRVFAVEGARVVAATRYRLDGELAPQAGAPAAVIAFVEARLSEWMPTPAVALDIAEIDGKLRILELTDTHSAGHYAADVEAIVVAISKIVESRYPGA